MELKIFLKIIKSSRCFESTQEEILLQFLKCFGISGYDDSLNTVKSWINRGIPTNILHKINNINNENRIINENTFLEMFAEQINFPRIKLQNSFKKEKTYYVDCNTEDNNAFYKSILVEFAALTKIKISKDLTSSVTEIINNQKMIDLTMLYEWQNVFLRNQKLKNDISINSSLFNGLKRDYENIVNSGDIEENYIFIITDKEPFSKERYDEKYSKYEKELIAAQKKLNNYKKEFEESKEKLNKFIEKKYGTQFAEAINEYLEDEYFISHLIKELEDGDSGNLIDISKKLLIKIDEEF